MFKYKKVIIKIIVSTLLFGVLFSKIDLQQVAVNFKLLDFSYIPLIILLLISNYVISSVRWKYLLIYENSEKASIPYLTNLYFIGAFFNNFMPTSIGGDVYKIYKLGKKIDSVSNAFSATFMERFTGIITLVLISYFGLIQTLNYWLQFSPANIYTNEILLFIVKVFIFLGFWIFLLFSFISLKFVSKKVEKVNKLYKSLLRYKGQNKVLLLAFTTSFIVQFLAIFTQYFIFVALGVDLPVLYSFFVFPIITLASFFIPSLNGLGVQDVLYVQLFSGVGVASELALAASIIYHISRLVVSLIGGLLYAIGKSD